ncbi:transcriptional regulator, AsnC family [Pseudomonas seleniipraecipitans]|jgi:Lrp/AsnC family transcriptional regulator, leucine-responsive regulatory protein|uniref:Transcriptional regulator, AsnC family n=1 Tax=Phytopseudomonas seleniipraecipitans TaxID=640205 RepID=A0A1G7GKB1_9GAMM|nr:transcriptional regulator, AsnC family [Pseudomonas seleniipraecipitans]
MTDETAGIPVILFVQSGAESPVDKFDQRIIALLRADARLSVTEVARQVSLSRSAVSERIRQLEASGVIQGYHARIAEPTSVAVRAYLELFYTGGRCEQYVERMRVFPEVRRCSGISGETDMMVYVEAPSMQRLAEVRGEIENFPGVYKVKTHVLVKDWLM